MFVSTNILVNIDVIAEERTNTQMLISTIWSIIIKKKSLSFTF